MFCRRSAFWRRCSAGVLIPGVIALSGCATTYRFTVDAVQSPVSDRGAQSFHLVNANPETTARDESFVVLAGHVCTALSSKGMFKAPEGVRPDVEVEIDCGIDLVGREVETAAWDVSDPYDPKRKRVTVYEKFLRITAREPVALGPGFKGREHWSVFVTNEDEGKDLPSFAILLVSAAMDALGGNTAGERTIVLPRRDERIAFVERGM